MNFVLKCSINPVISLKYVYPHLSHDRILLIVEINSFRLINKSSFLAKLLEMNTEWKKKTILQQMLHGSKHKDPQFECK
jgi:hypothetical protein